MRLTVPSEYEGKPLRTYLRAELGLSRRLTARLKAQPDGMMLDGRPVTVRALLQTGQVLDLAIEQSALQDGNEPATRPGGKMPPVLYEDADILLCNKPGDMPTHPSHGHIGDTLANAVAAYDIAQGGQTRVFHPITRLDRATSGVVLIARHRLAASRLSEAMRRQEMQKYYLAILCGVPTPSNGCIDAPIRRVGESIILRQVCAPDAPGASTALTEYRVLCDWQDSRGKARCLVLAHPLTGRTHQLRVHFAHLGTPILGDTLYGIPSAAPTPDRQALHALSLTFSHPMSGHAMTCRAPLPEDMLACLPTAAQEMVTQLLTKEILP